MAQIRAAYARLEASHAQLQEEYKAQTKSLELVHLVASLAQAQVQAQAQTQAKSASNASQASGTSSNVWRILHAEFSVAYEAQSLELAALKSANGAQSEEIETLRAVNESQAEQITALKSAQEESTMLQMAHQTQTAEVDALQAALASQIEVVSELEAKGIYLEDIRQTQAAELAKLKIDGETMAESLVACVKERGEALSSTMTKIQNMHEEHEEEVRMIRAQIARASRAQISGDIDFANDGQQAQTFEGAASTVESDS